MLLDDGPGVKVYRTAPEMAFTMLLFKERVLVWRTALGLACDEEVFEHDLRLSP